MRLDNYPLPFFTLFLLLFLPLTSYAVYTNIDPDDGDNYDDLYDYGYAYSPAYTATIMTGDQITSVLAMAACNVQKEGLEANNSPTNTTEIYNGTCSNEYSEPQGRVNWSYTFCQKVYWTLGGVIKSDNCGYIASGFVYGQPVETRTCPPDDRQDAVVEAILGEALHCFEQADLNTRDSCPDSTQDGGYVLPVTPLNTADNICLDKPDGSSCKYTKQDDIYITDFENNCYELNGLDRWNDGDVTQPDPTDSNCQDIGNGVTACPEDPANVCNSSSICQSGCGFMALPNFEEAFVCISGDTDSDGLADYLDPDIDGDGIANGDDLDADGDGQDDPVYDSESSVADNSVIEGLLATGNSIADDARNGIGSVNAGLGALNQKVEGIGKVTEKPTGTFPTQAETQLEIDAATLELEALFVSIRADMDSVFTITKPTAEFFGCYDITSFGGSIKRACATQFADELIIISYALLFVFALLSVVIILR